MRSESVDLPWSMCAMIEKLRMRDCSMKGLVRPVRNEAKPTKILLFAHFMADALRRLGGAVRHAQHRW
ncbi:MAG: hypothetical protein EBW53_02230 [Actinobacteria bacterium]|nr:hypothetical protein [Actinomycetota bacterium]